MSIDSGHDISEGRFLNSLKEYVGFSCPLSKTLLVGSKEVEFSKHLLSAFPKQEVFVLVCHSVKQIGSHQLDIINIRNLKDMQQYSIDY